MCVGGGEGRGGGSHLSAIMTSLCFGVMMTVEVGEFGHVITTVCVLHCISELH